MKNKKKLQKTQRDLLKSIYYGIKIIEILIIIILNVW